MNKKRLTFILLFLLSIPTLAHAFTYNSKEFKSTISQLDMQGHADHELSSCSVKKIYYEEVLEMLNDGKTEKDIIQSYVDEYGQAALRTPGGGTNGWIAWGMPAVGFVIGIMIVTSWIRKRTARKADMTIAANPKWESETAKEIAAKTFDEERRKLF